MKEKKKESAKSTFITVEMAPPTGRLEERHVYH